MTRKLSAIFIISLLAVVFLAASSFGMKASDKNKALNVVPINQAPLSKIAGAEAPVSVISGKAPAAASLGFDQAMGYAPGIRIGVTTYDYQHNGRMGREVDWRGAQVVHFAWMKQISTTLGENRRTGYEAYDAGIGDFAQAGASDSGGCDVHAILNNTSGYVTLDVDTEGKVVLANHHQETGAAADYATTIWYDYDQGTCYFAPYRSKVPDSTMNYFADPLDEKRYIWPSMEYQVWDGDTVTHAFSQQTKNGINAQFVVYFRRVGSDTVGAWDYPPMMVDTVNDIAQTVTASRVSGKVALCWLMCYPGIMGDGESIQRGGNQRVNDVFYMMSTDMGATWGPKVNVTQFDSSKAGWLAHTDMSALIGTDDKLHIIWDAREYGPEGGGVWRAFFGSRLFHWGEGSIVRTIKDANWVLADDGCFGGAWNEMSITKMQISECAGKFYALFVMYNDYFNGITNDCHQSNFTANNSSGSANGELFISVSDNGGLNWDLARNLTNTRTPHCDTVSVAPGFSICGSEVWPSMSRFGMNKTGGTWTGIPIVDPSGSYTGNMYLDVFYVQDKYPGGCVQDQGVWTFNQMKWFRVPCIEPVPNPLLSFSPARIVDPAWTKPSVQLDSTLKLENIGNAVLHINAVNVVKTTHAGLDWLGISGVPGTVSHLIPNFVNATVNLNKGGAITTGPAVGVGFIEFVTDAPTSPDTLLIRLIVADTVQFPEWASIRTACKRIVLNNAGNLGRANQGLNNVDGFNMNFFNDCDTTLNGTGRDDNSLVYLYDASPFILRAKGALPGDTILNSYIFDADWLDNDGFRPMKGLVVDSTTHPDYQYAYTGQFLTKDSGMGVECEYWMPLHPDTCSFLIQKIRIVNKSGVAYSNLMIGELMDWDIPSDSGVENGSDYDATRQMMWCYGGEYGPDSLPNNDCVLANNRAGGFAYLNGYKLPITGAGDLFPNITGLYTHINPDWVAPTGNFVPQQLYNKLNTFSGYQAWLSTKPTMEDSLYQDLNMVAYYGKKNLGVNDTLVWIKIIATERNNGAAGLKATIDKAKQWWKNRFNMAPIVIDPGIKIGIVNAPLTFTVYGLDPDGPLSGLTMVGTGLPAGATFTDNNNGSGTFSWPTPTPAGTYYITVTASDGKDSGFRVIQINIINTCCVKAGDVNHNNIVNIADVTYLIKVLYQSGPKPPCQGGVGKYPEADANGNGITNIADVTYLIKFLYQSGPAPICGPM
ncbi:MAG: putative Ig domain-containing protein [candidate division Zixibacteria bacterium]|nr:putative Ig domain-containing protein [candidate division Zixibacteria bacterium]